MKEVLVEWKSKEKRGVIWIGSGGGPSVIAMPIVGGPGASEASEL